MRRKRAGTIYLSDHAYRRWQLRVGGKAKKSKIRADIRHRLMSELKLGADVNKNGGLEIEVRPGIWAICYPSLMGGWVVATIIREGWNGDMEERAKYGGEESNRLESAIEYFEDAIFESNEIIADCSDDLKKELSKQKEHFVVALEATRGIKEAGQA